tara:strand:- start:1860 stop:2216 length:357 start_codon:yes stop_codon:yes gene_type:complete
MTATGQHPDAARLRHGQQIDDSDDSEKKEGHLKDGRERERKHDQTGNSSGETQRTRLIKSGRIASTLRRSSVALEWERGRPTGRQPLEAPQNFSTWYMGGEREERGEERIRRLYGLQR